MEKTIVDMSKATRIYMGKDRYCRCGCGGEYVSRGDAKFERRLKRFQAMWEGYNPSEIDVSYDVAGNLEYLNVSYGDREPGRALTVYFS
jgi:hypothetical protein